MDGDIKSSVEALNTDLDIAAAFMSIAEVANDRRRAQSAFKAAVKHYNDVTQRLLHILGTMSAADADRCRDKITTLELRLKRFEKRWASP
ncbi:MAG: hypothetical protein ABW110_19840 [Steroidobacteraceae bacterium]